jgi:hypothetical protein
MRNVYQHDLKSFDSVTKIELNENELADIRSWLSTRQPFWCRDLVVSYGNIKDGIRVTFSELFDNTLSSNVNVPNRALVRMRKQIAAMAL